MAGYWLAVSVCELAQAAASQFCDSKKVCMTIILMPHLQRDFWTGKATQRLLTTYV